MPARTTEAPSVVRRATNRITSLVHSEPSRGPNVNVGQTERWASMIGGGALAFLGLRSGDMPGLLVAALGGALVYRGLSGHCTMYAALDLSTARDGEGTRTSISAGQGVKFEESVTINKPAAELYRFWRNFENLPKVMNHLESVTFNGKKSHWKAKGPAGLSLEWDAEIITERENELIGWRSLEGSEVATAGSVHFRDLGGDRGTQVHVVMKYKPQAGKVGAMVARLFGRAPEQEVSQDLHNFKTLLEVGELPTTEGQPRGTCG